MSARWSLYADATIERVVGERMVGPDGNRSGVIGRCLDRYQEIVQRSRPDLSVPEWRLCFDAFDASMTSISWAGIADGMNRLGPKWGVDGRSLLARIHALPYAGIVALVDEAERYWAAVGRGEDPRVPGEER